VSSQQQVVTEVEGRRLTLTNLDKVLYPGAGFTKADVISYYVKIAPALLPHLHGRPITFTRYPNGVEGEHFFEKRLPRGAPEWVRTARVPLRSRRGQPSEIEFPLIDDLPGLVWAANLAALELHTPMWRSIGDGEYGPFDLMVFDLDPGLPATVVECCRIGLRLQEMLSSEGLQAYPKTSGSKGLQLYASLDPPRPAQDVHQRAREMARQLEQRHPEEVLSNMRRDLRAGKVFVDWSQNHPAKTTISPYSLRARPQPTVSTPVTWDEVEQCARHGDPERLRFAAPEVLERVEAHGDLFAPLGWPAAGSRSDSRASTATVPTATTSRRGDGVSGRTARRSGRGAS
jgi:bifunctional non-homologous end joining protein LigD